MANAADDGESTQVTLLPTKFGRTVASHKTRARPSDDKFIEIKASLYTPFEHQDTRWYCSYRVWFDGRIVIKGSGPGTDRLTALFMGLALLSVELDRERMRRGLVWLNQEFWWIDRLLNGPPAGSGNRAPAPH